MRHRQALNSKPASVDVFCVFCVCGGGGAGQTGDRREGVGWGRGAGEPGRRGLKERGWGGGGNRGAPRRQGPPLSLET